MRSRSRYQVGYSQSLGREVMTSCQNYRGKGRDASMSDVAREMAAWLVSRYYGESTVRRSEA